MNNLYWALVWVVVVSCSPKSKPFHDGFTDKQLRQEELNHQCKRIHDFEVNNRLAHYPYNDASEVWIISFDNREEGDFSHSIPVHNGIIDQAKIKEKKVLSKIQIDSLLIFYLITDFPDMY